MAQPEMNVKECVEKKISESSTLIEALESVGAMYGIPPTNIIEDDRLKGIRVQGDTILAPDRGNPSANTRSIVCAIGAVLDNISQRIDQKLNTFQNTQIKQNIAIASQRAADPSKGDVVGRFTDANGAEIIAYSTGLVDMDCTPEANAKVKELRDTKQIPDIEQDVQKSTGYFSDEDDVMADVSTTTADDTSFDTDSSTMNIAEQIGESAYHLDLFNEFNESTSLGYDMLRSYGFDYVDRTHAIIQEADGDSSGADMSQIRHMRFDNSEILKAINLFNEAKEELGEVESIPVFKLMRSDKWKDGIRALEKQFDCLLDVDYSDSDHPNMGTLIDMDMKRPKLKISKSKGFQLSGTKIRIIIQGDMLDIFTRKRGENLFGQSLISVFLHEIFHNITQMLRYYNAEFIGTMSSAMMLATSTKNVKARRAVLSNAVKTMDCFDGKKLNIITRKKLVRELLQITALQYDMKAIEELKKKIESSESSAEQVDEYIKQLEEAMNGVQETLKRNDKTTTKIANKICLVLGIISAFGAFLTAGLTMLIAIPCLAYWNSTWMTSEKLEKAMKEYLSHPNKEEYYCDIFAGIYQLPVSFFLAGFDKGVTAKEVDTDVVKKLQSLEVDLYKIMFATYPTDAERSYAGMRIAKKILESGEVIPDEVKEYCQWVVDNYKSLEDAGIKENHNAATFNPEEAEDLDAHIERIINNGEVTVTESANVKPNKSSGYYS